mmetsp:Transcript_34121/g.57332  ORF Transcript_34121/g.57332 Transcript_34121/m.57332 type:complete len:275 (-) Transcript_34121:374-1198(-)
MLRCFDDPGRLPTVVTVARIVCLVSVQPLDQILLGVSHHDGKVLAFEHRNVVAAVAASHGFVLRNTHLLANVLQRLELACHDWNHIQIPPVARPAHDQLRAHTALLQRGRDETFRCAHLLYVHPDGDLVRVHLPRGPEVHFVGSTHSDGAGARGQDHTLLPSLTQHIRPRGVLFQHADGIVLVHPRPHRRDQQVRFHQHIFLLLSELVILFKRSTCAINQPAPSSPGLSLPVVFKPQRRRIVPHHRTVQIAHHHEDGIYPRRLNRLVLSSARLC